MFGFANNSKLFVNIRRSLCFLVLIFEQASGLLVNTSVRVNRKSNKGYLLTFGVDFPEIN